jgi:hypothetical protein
MVSSWKGELYALLRAQPVGGSRIQVEINCTPLCTLQISSTCERLRWWRVDKKAGHVRIAGHRQLSPFASGRAATFTRCRNGLIMYVLHNRACLVQCEDYRMV